MSPSKYTEGLELGHGVRGGIYDLVRVKIGADAKRISSRIAVGPCDIAGMDGSH